MICNNEYNYGKTPAVIGRETLQKCSTIPLLRVLLIPSTPIVEAYFLVGKRFTIQSYIQGILT